MKKQSTPIRSNPRTVASSSPIVWGIASSILSAFLILSPHSNAQPPKTSPPANENRQAAESSPPDAALTEGLLELLPSGDSPNDKSEANRDPKTTAPSMQPPAGSKSNSTPNSNTPRIAPFQDGEDVGQGPESPLANVMRYMTFSAEQLRTVESSRNAVEGQQIALDELDRLITALTQAQRERKQSSQNQSQATQTASSQKPQPNNEPTHQEQQRSQSNGQEQVQPDNSAKSSSQPPRASDSEQNQSSQNQGESSSTANPGNQAGRSAATTAGPLDVRTLQQSAWGKLPEKRREQMNTRAVERFLPAYRQDIEAYYRALAK